ncbi:hypothetical protein FI667_g3081, partial [Globisporangium splendens]
MFCHDLIKLQNLNHGKVWPRFTLSSPPSSINGAKFDRFQATWEQQLAFDIAWLGVLNVAVAIFWWGRVVLEAAVKQDQDTYGGFLKSSATPPRKSANAS